MYSNSRRRKIRLTPFGYLVLSGCIVVVLLCVYLIIRAAGGASLRPVGEAVAATPILGGDGEAAPAEKSDDMTVAHAAGLDDPTPVPSEPVNTPVPTPTINAAASTPGPAMTPTPSPAAYSRTPSPEEVAAARDGELSTGGINLRAGPSTNDNIIGTDFARGTRLKVYAQEGDFYFVQIVAKEIYGFIATKFVKVEGVAAATASPQPTTIPAGAVGGFVNASKLALRNGPGKDYTNLNVFPRNTQLYVFFLTGEWYYVEIAATGQCGYMKVEYVTPEGTPPSGTPIPQ